MAPQQHDSRRPLQRSRIRNRKAYFAEIKRRVDVRKWRQQKQDEADAVETLRVAALKKEVARKAEERRRKEEREAEERRREELEDQRRREEEKEQYYSCDSMETDEDDRKKAKEEREKKQDEELKKMREEIIKDMETQKIIKSMAKELAKDAIRSFIELYKQTNGFTDGTDEPNTDELLDLANAKK